MSSSGLANTVAGNSSISTVGLGSGLNYRGFNVNELAKKSTFEEVAFLLLFGCLPTTIELNWVRNTVNNSRVLSASLINVLGSVLIS